MDVTQDIYFILLHLVLYLSSVSRFLYKFCTTILLKFLLLATLKVVCIGAKTEYYNL